MLAVRAGVAELRLDLGAVHDARVALRRLRGTLAVFAPVLDAVPAPLATDLRWFARQVAGTRDAEVVADRLNPSLTEAADAEASRILLERLHLWAVAASEVAHLALADERTSQLLDTLGRLHLNATGTPQIYLEIRTQRLAVRALEDLCDVAPLVLAQAQGAARGRRARLLHSLRKQVKSTRAVIAVLDVTEAERSRLAKSLRRVQELLGEHHDAVVSRAWLKRLAVRDPVTADLARSLRSQDGSAMDGVEERLPQAVARLIKQVDRVRRTPTVHLSSP